MAAGLQPDHAASIAAIVPHLPVTGESHLVAEVLLNHLKATLQDREALDVYYRLHCAILEALLKMVEDEAVAEVFMQHAPRVRRHTLCALSGPLSCSPSGAVPSLLQLKDSFTSEGWFSGTIVHHSVHRNSIKLGVHVRHCAQVAARARACVCDRERRVWRFGGMSFWERRVVRTSDELVG